jgi:hypothetical protein
MASSGGLLLAAGYKNSCGCGRHVRSGPRTSDVGQGLTSPQANTATPEPPGNVDPVRPVIMPETAAFGGHNIATKPRLGTTRLEHRYREDFRIGATR